MVVPVFDKNLLSMGQVWCESICPRPVSSDKGDITSNPFIPVKLDCLNVARAESKTLTACDFLKKKYLR